MRSYYPLLAFLALTVFETGTALALLSAPLYRKPRMVSFISDSIDTLVCVLLSGVLIRVGVFLNTHWDRGFSQAG